MNKTLLWVLGSICSAVFTLSVLIGAWWVGRVNASMDVTVQLQWKDHYMNGNVAAAPVAQPELRKK